MDEYEKKANDFLKKTDTQIFKRYIKTGKHFVADKENRDIYEIKIIRYEREYIFKYGDSVHDTEKRLISYLTKNRLDEFGYNVISYFERLKNGDYGAKGYSMQFEHRNTFKKMTESEEDLKEWESLKTKNENLKPSNYYVLSCLDGFVDCDDVDEFAEEFGYTKPSEAIRVFNAVKKQADELQKIFNDDELEQLNEIN